MLLLIHDLYTNSPHTSQSNNILSSTMTWPIGSHRSTRMPVRNSLSFCNQFSFGLLCQEDVHTNINFIPRYLRGNSQQTNGAITLPRHRSFLDFEKTRNRGSDSRTVRPPKQEAFVCLQLARVCTTNGEKNRATR